MEIVHHQQVPLEVLHRGRPEYVPRVKTAKGGGERDYGSSARVITELRGPCRRDPVFVAL